MAKDASLSMDAPYLSDTSRPGQIVEERAEWPWISEQVSGGEPVIRPWPRSSGSMIADKIWAWEQKHFPIKGPRLRLRGRGYRPDLSISRILAWADAHFAATGQWPTARTGRVVAAPLRRNLGRHPIGTEPGPAGPAGGLVAGPVAG